jgi:hypothetical protein
MEILHLRITLKGSKPPIWRRVAVASDITLGQLHEVIQIVMGWTDSHLHHFILRGKGLKPRLRELPKSTGQSKREEIILPDGRRGIVLTNIPAPNSPEATPAKPIAPIPTCRDRYFVTKVTPWGNDTEMEGEDENAVTLGKVCPKVKSKLIYEYDFGDGWEHVIEVQKIVEPETGVEYPVCLAGKKACPPEDCGGVWGYYELLATIADPDHEEHEEMLEWLGEGSDPDAFDLEEVNAMLAEWRKGNI